MEKKRWTERARRKYLIGGTVTVHLAVTSGIPLPVCGETLQGSFTFSHRFSKMAHLTPFGSVSFVVPFVFVFVVVVVVVVNNVAICLGAISSNVEESLSFSYNSYGTWMDHSRFSLGWSTPVKVTPLLISPECPWVRRPSSLLPVLLLSLSSLARPRTTPFQEFYRGGSIQRSIIQSARTFVDAHCSETARGPFSFTSPTT